MPRYNSTDNVNTVIYTQNGVFIAPPNVSLVYVTLVGGGGGSAVNGLDRSGGGAGASLINIPVYILPGQIIDITIGQSGSGVGGVTAGNGGTTFFGSMLYAGGGNGGDTVFGGGQGGNIIGFSGSVGASPNAAITSSLNIVSRLSYYSGFVVGCGGGDNSVFGGSVIASDGNPTVQVGGQSDGGGGASLFGFGGNNTSPAMGYGSGGGNSQDGRAGLCIISWD